MVFCGLANLLKDNNQGLQSLTVAKVEIIDGPTKAN